MNTNTASRAHDTTTPGTKSWYRRSVAPVGIAAGLALALALSACGTDQAVKHTSADKVTTTSVAGNELGSSTTSTGVSADDGTQASGQSSANSGSGGSGNGSTDNSGDSGADPTIDSFTTPENIDCHNGNLQEFTASWETSNATKVTISIDGGGVYNEYAVDGEAGLPFNCSSEHTFLLTAYGHGDKKAYTAVTLDPRNVQTEDPGDDEDAMQTTAKVSGGATPGSDATNEDCERGAANIEAMTDLGIKKQAAGDQAGANEAYQLADDIEQAGGDIGCVFIYT